MYCTLDTYSVGLLTPFNACIRVFAGRTYCELTFRVLSHTDSMLSRNYFNELR